MNTEPIKIGVCNHVLGLTFAEQYADIALQALEAGYDSPSLRFLAGLPAIAAAEASVLFDRCMAELSLPRPSRRDAVRQLAKIAAAQILDGATTPYQGAKEIWSLSLHLVGERLPELDPFVYAASELEDRPEDHLVFEKGVMAAARDFVCQ